MAKINQILLILIVVLALAAAAFSYLLFQRRAEFRQRGEDFATTVRDVTGTLDEKSNSGASGDVTFTPADPETKTPESGTLSWRAYHEAQTEKEMYDEFKKEDFPNALQQTEALAGAIETQRNKLANGFFKTGLNLGLSEPYISLDGLLELQLEQPQYTEMITTIIQHAEKLKGRDEAMIETIDKSADILDYSLDAGKLKTRSEGLEGELGDFQHEQVLSTFETEVDNLKTRADDYERTLKAAIQEIGNFDWNVQAAKIGDEQRYKGALGTLKADYGKIEDKLARIPILEDELETARNKLEKAEEELKKKRERIATLKEGPAEGETSGIIREKEEEIKELESKLKNALTQGRKFEGKLEGKVVQVNRKWGFVVLNVGLDDVTAGSELLVGREGQFITRLKVTKVTPKNAIANIVQDIKDGKVKVGDEVTYAPSAKKEEKEGQEQG